MDDLKKINCKEIFRKAYENRYTWKNDFNGYQGKCIFMANNICHKGDFILGKDFKPNIQKIEDEKIVKSIASQLFEVCIHRVKREFLSVHLENNFKKIIQNFKDYYQSDIAVANVHLKRNFGLKEASYYDKQKRTKQFEFYNNYFHCDYYTMNYFKLFINLQDISPEDGPLTFYSKKILASLKYFRKLYNPYIKGKLNLILFRKLTPEIDFSDDLLFTVKRFNGK